MTECPDVIDFAPQNPGCLDYDYQNPGILDYSPTDFQVNRVLQNNPQWLMGRIYLGKDLMLQTDIQAISYEAFYHDLSDQSVSSGTISPAQITALVTDDPRWKPDTEGYNFAFTAPAACFPNPGRVEVVVEFTPVSTSKFTQKWNIPVEHSPSLT